MALIDVTDVLSDPDFCDYGIICERNSQIIGEDGLARNTITKTRFTGVVTTNEGDLLDQLATGQRIKGSILIHTKFVLKDGTVGFAADIVEWRAKRYTVSKVSDYSHYGRGFVCATCDLLPLSG